MPNPRTSCEVSSKTPENGDFVYCRYVHRNGKIIYPKHAKFFKFPRNSLKRNAYGN